ncbi:hypothetical protein BSZ35_04670 [Salinibacter sp. 10B]|uniref:hypothetical protein n=1 Tax=Salinibacter sp. 10B TaxID=1923971 RepID=UPI000CF487E6|nr:hypothetical protein [Salinibacter sp. 10B]PQJ34001.1 hypothetical protein BSZ35_04670 [Salinibacter sp. 10B]
MASTHTVQANAISDNSSATELDIYAGEFAKLVNRYAPSRTDAPSDWLGRLPDEAFHYYDRGISTFGGEAQSPIDRRGRLYLVHTALLFMWMSWGKTTARERFQSDAHKGTCRTASLITLEHYKRGGVLAGYKTYDWFFQPVEEWTISLNSSSVTLDALPPDADIRSPLQEKSTIRGTVKLLSRLRSIKAVPTRSALPITGKT